ncbi:uncharacterized protein ISCGN_000022 [Ixodes scapularis]
MERMVLARIDWIIEHKREVLHPAQTGFRKNLGTQDSLVLIREYLVNRPTHCHPQLLVAVDIKKAFDTLPHATVIDTARKLGVRGRPLNFIKAFLSGRKYLVKTGKHCSSEQKTNEIGVPQGAVLSPVLFNLAMAPLLWRLAVIPDLAFTVYADDITATRDAQDPGDPPHDVLTPLTRVPQALKSAGNNSDDEDCHSEESELSTDNERERSESLNASDENYDVQDDVVNSGEDYGDDDDEMNGNDPVPQPLLEHLLSSCFNQFGTETLPHSTTTKAGAIAMIMAHVVSQGMTWSGLDSLLVLINALFGRQVVPQSKYAFRKLWSATTKNLVRHYYLCEGCGAVLEDAETAASCSVCQQGIDLKVLKENGSYFVMLDMTKQLSFVIEKTKELLHNNLLKLAMERSTSSSGSGVTDITTGEAYDALRRKTGMGDSDLSLTFNTDGSPLFVSSKTSVWPIQFTVNELPPSIRFKHTTLAGLWFGKGHPNMTAFLAKFVDQVKSMTPVMWEHSSEMHRSRAYVLCCCVDAPARAAVQNMVLFNGSFGCPWCLISGEHLEGSMRYVPKEPPAPRTSELVVRDMQLSLRLGITINGIKGPSPLMNLPGFDLVAGVSVEYMHAVLQGAAKQFTELLLSSSNSQKRFYIGTSYSTKMSHFQLQVGA